jgi:hypothetical protein
VEIGTANPNRLGWVPAYRKSTRTVAHTNLYTRVHIYIEIYAQ